MTRSISGKVIVLDQLAPAHDAVIGHELFGEGQRGQRASADEVARPYRRAPTL